jgi:hypothetical protein
MSTAAHQFATDVTAAAEAMRRARDQDVSGDVREQVQLLARAVVAQGKEIDSLKAALGALAREAQKA